MSKCMLNPNNTSICVLTSENSPETKYVLLDKEPLTLGRTPQTGITDQRMSKNQLKFEADYSMGRVLVEQVGSNKSAINEESMIKGEKRVLHHGDKVSLLYNSNYTFRLDFVPPHSYGLESSKKRSASSFDQDVSPKKPRSATPSSWETKDGTLLVFNSSNLIHKHKIAAFDMDGTIITTQSGKVFPIDEKDWKINCPEVTKVIRQLSEDNYKIVIFTNQGGIGKLKVNEKAFKMKVQNIVDVIKTPVQVFVATRSDIYRKPAPGMWDTFIHSYNGGLSIDKNASFYCGDAAGRPARTVNGKKVKKDHSCCDRLFAINIGFKFYTPEEYFWKTSLEEFKLPIFNPNDVIVDTQCVDLQSKLFSSSKEMVLMVGCPASGKSYFALKQLGCHNRLKIINRDTLGTWQKCISEAKKHLENNLSVIIDNTNPDVESRKRFIEVAKHMNVSCRVFLMNVSKEHARHNNKFRELTDKSHQKVSEIVINTYFSKFEEPSINEGIEEIIKINFVPRFKDSKLEKLYRMYLL